MENNSVINYSIQVLAEMIQVICLPDIKFISIIQQWKLKQILLNTKILVCIYGAGDPITCRITIDYIITWQYLKDIVH